MNDPICLRVMETPGTPFVTHGKDHPGAQRGGGVAEPVFEVEVQLERPGAARQKARRIDQRGDRFGTSGKW